MKAENENAEAVRTAFSRLNDESGKPANRRAYVKAKQNLLTLLHSETQWFWNVRLDWTSSTGCDCVLFGDRLIKAVGDASLVELRGGPFVTEEEAEQSQHLMFFNEAMEDYELPQPGVVQYSHPGTIVPDDCPDSAVFIGEVKWTEEHSQLFYLFKNSNPPLWLLWQQYRNSGVTLRSLNGASVMFGIAHLSQEGMNQVQAAKALLKYGLEEERDEDMKPIVAVTQAGCLTVEEIQDIADEVWKPPEPVDLKVQNASSWETVQTNRSLILNEAAEAIAPKNMPRDAVLLARTEVTYSMASESIQLYYLSQNRRKMLWFLWKKRWDDNWSRWEQPVVSICMPDEGFEEVDAACSLIRASWLRDEVEWSDGPFDVIQAGPGLDQAMLDCVANEIWGNDQLICEE